MNPQKENELKNRAANIAEGLSEIRISLTKLEETIAQLERERYLYIPAPEQFTAGDEAQQKERKRKRIPAPEIAPAELFQTVLVEI